MRARNGGGLSVYTCVSFAHYSIKYIENVRCVYVVQLHNVSTVIAFRYNRENEGKKPRKYWIWTTPTSFMFSTFFLWYYYLPIHPSYQLHNYLWVWRNDVVIYILNEIGKQSIFIRGNVIEWDVRMTEKTNKLLPIDQMLGWGFFPFFLLQYYAYREHILKVFSYSSQKRRSHSSANLIHCPLTRFAIGHKFNLVHSRFAKLNKQKTMDASSSKYIYFIGVYASMYNNGNPAYIYIGMQIHSYTARTYVLSLHIQIFIQRVSPPLQYKCTIL